MQLARQFALVSVGLLALAAAIVFFKLADLLP